MNRMKKIKKKPAKLKNKQIEPINRAFHMAVARYGKMGVEFNEKYRHYAEKYGGSFKKNLSKIMNFKHPKFGTLLEMAIRILKLGDGEYVKINPHVLTYLIGLGAEPKLKVLKQLKALGKNLQFPIFCWPEIIKFYMGKITQSIAYKKSNWMPTAAVNLAYLKEWAQFVAEKTDSPIMIDCDISYFSQLHTIQKEYRCEESLYAANCIYVSLQVFNSLAVRAKLHCKFVAHVSNGFEKKIYERFRKDDINILLSVKKTLSRFNNSAPNSFFTDEYARICSEIARYTMLDYVLSNRNDLVYLDYIEKQLLNAAHIFDTNKDPRFRLDCYARMLFVVILKLGINEQVNPHVIIDYISTLYKYKEEQISEAAKILLIKNTLFTKVLLEKLPESKEKMVIIDLYKKLLKVYFNAFKKDKSSNKTGILKYCKKISTYKEHLRLLDPDAEELKIKPIAKNVGVIAPQPIQQNVKLHNQDNKEENGTFNAKKIVVEKSPKLLQAKELTAKPSSETVKIVVSPSVQKPHTELDNKEKVKIINASEPLLAKNSIKKHPFKTTEVVLPAVQAPHAKTANEKNKDFDGGQTRIVQDYSQSDYKFFSKSKPGFNLNKKSDIPKKNEVQQKTKYDYKYTLFSIYQSKKTKEAGICDATIVKQKDLIGKKTKAVTSDMYEGWQRYLNVGDIVGRWRSGIRLVSKTEQKKYNLNKFYKYKIALKKENPRLYGRELSKNHEDYNEARKRLIFDAVRGH